ncbi:hypothetical protein AAFF_G00096040 [Aldrovandia affinis]|uniref:Heterochromatin protein 1-binding protein 3 n=1 Tax=Aldrovandia affinis TaxID=143900 RepID=A0AAD7RVU1_9TELE|nr:hypothetical protein AAFF_G00096040 [Aldrovandia affinis]
MNEACKDRSGASAYAVMKYITNKYDMLDLDKRKFLLRKALNRLIEKRIVKQLKGKGFSGSFTIDKLPPKATSDKPVVAPGVKAETLGDSLPLIITRLCEPKEASYMLIKKYLEQHFPKLNVEHRPDLLKGALQRAVEKGYLEQITGKGASGTFQLKRSGDKHLLKGGALEDAVLTAITAMNEPKSCSTTLLRKFLVESHKDIKAYMLVNNLKRTLKRCKMLGWMEQVTGSGLNGTYQLCYPYYPSPAILFPDKQTKESEEDDSEEEEEEGEEEDSEEEDDESEDEPPPRKRSRQQKRPPSKVRHPPSAKKRRPANQRGRGRRPAPIKRLAASVKKPAKKPAPPAKKAVPPPKKSKPVPSRKSSPPAKATAAKATAAKATAAKATAAKATAAKATAAKATAAKATAAKATAAKATAAKATPAKATPVKKAAPASKPKTPIAKKMTSRAPTKSAAKKSPAPKAPPQSAVKAKPAARKSLRSRK